MNAKLLKSIIIILSASIFIIAIGIFSKFEVKTELITTELCADNSINCVSNISNAFEVKITYDNTDYWIVKDYCNSTNCDANTCEIISKEKSYLYEGDFFIFDDFIEHWQNNVGYVTGEKFIGFYDDNGLVFNWFGDAVPNLMEETINLTPRYVDEVYTFTLDGNEGEINSDLFIEANYNQILDLSSIDIIRYGYKLVGWDIDGEIYSNNYLVPDFTDNENGDFDYIIMKAIWEAKTFDVNLVDGSTNIGTITVKYDQEIGELPTPSDNGYKFLGWKIEGSDTFCNFKTKWLYDHKRSINVIRNVVATKYSISYDLNGGIGIDYPDNYNVTEEINLQNPSKLGYKFTGWKINGIFKPKNESNLIEIVNKGSIGNLSLVAIFEAKEYKLKARENITFNDEYVYIDITKLSTLIGATVKIGEGVKEITFYNDGNQRNGLYVTVESHLEVLNINIIDVNLLSIIGGSIFDLGNSDMTYLNCIGNNLMKGQINLHNNIGNSPSLIQSRGLCISGDRLEMIGGNGSDFGFSGGHCISAVGIAPTFMTKVELKLKYFSAIGGNGGNGTNNTSFSDKGGTGGCGIMCLIGVEISSNTEAHFVAGKGGKGYGLGEDGSDGIPIGLGFLGSYYDEFGNLITSQSS